MTFYHKCDKCGNFINLSNRVNANLPDIIKAIVRFEQQGGMEGIEREYLRRTEFIRQEDSPNRRRRHYWPRYGRIVSGSITKKVIEFDQVAAEYEGHDSFWSMEDVVVTCPSCGHLEGWAAYVTDKDVEVHYTALCSTRYEDV